MVDSSHPTYARERPPAGLGGQPVDLVGAEPVAAGAERAVHRQAGQSAQRQSIGAAAMILSLNKILNQQQNILEQHQRQHDTTQHDRFNGLQNVTNLLLQAQNIASADVNSSTNSQQQQGDSQVVNSIISEMQSLANTNSNGVYVFGGENGQHRAVHQWNRRHPVRGHRQPDSKHRRSKLPDAHGSERRQHFRRLVFGSRRLGRPLAGRHGTDRSIRPRRR
jgi:hypothetical protein